MIDLDFDLVIDRNFIIGRREADLVLAVNFDAEFVRSFSSRSWVAKLSSRPPV